MVNWKVLAYFSAAGALISLIAGVAGGNRFGTILLRLFLSALVAGGIGLAVQYLLRRFLPELGRGAGREGPPAVDIVIDDQMDLGAPGGEPGAGFVVEAPPPLAGGEEGLLPELEPMSAGLAGGLGPELAAAGTEGAAGEATLGPEDFSEEPAEAAEALEPPEGSGTLSELDGLGPVSPSSRSLKAQALGDQLDSVVKGQDPASLAKAVRTFLLKDQEG